MNIKPIGNRILVKAEETETQTKSGIFLPETIDKTDKQIGKVIALGEGEGLKKLNIKVGNKVVFDKFTGSDIQVDKVDYKFLKHEDILGVIE